MQLQRLAAGRTSGADIGLRLDELAGVQVELQLLLFECLEDLLGTVQKGGDPARVAQLQQQLDALSKELLQ